MQKKIVGLSDIFLKKQKTFEENHEQLLNFIKNDTLIIHNAEFDIGFINNELSLIGKSPLNNPVIDTVPLARTVLNTRIANLDYLCRRFSIDLSDRSFHGALLDSHLLASVYLELKGGKQFSMQLEENGAISEKITTNNINTEKTKKIVITNEQIAEHKKMLKKINNPIWKKYNY